MLSGKARKLTLPVLDDFFSIMLLFFGVGFLPGRLCTGGVFDIVVVGLFGVCLHTVWLACY